MDDVSFDRLWDAIDDATDMERDESGVRLAGLEKEIRILMYMRTQDTSELMYALVYVLYMNPARVPNLDVCQRFETASEALLAQAPNHSLGQLFTAFHYYDLGGYARAMSTIQSRGEPELSSTLNMKRLELEACLRIRLFGYESAQDSLETLRSVFSQCPVNEVKPFNLANLVEEQPPARASAAWSTLEAIARLSAGTMKIGVLD